MRSKFKCIVLCGIPAQLFLYIILKTKQVRENIFVTYFLPNLKRSALFRLLPLARFSTVASGLYILPEKIDNLSADMLNKKKEKIYCTLI